MLTTTIPSGKVFSTVQLLRGLAALIVVFFHLTLADERGGRPLIIGGFFRNGFAGVDLFFVISGFVIMHTSHLYFSTPGYFGTYFRKRLIRVYPIYWVTVILIIGGIYLTEHIIRNPIDFLPKTWPLYISSFLLLPGHPMINGVTWSLSFELYYYLIFGLLIISRKLWPVVAGILVFSAIVLIYPALSASYTTLFTYFFSPYNLEFAAGVLAWWLIHRFKISTFTYGILLIFSVVLLMIHDTILFEEVSKRVIYYGTSSFFLLVAFTGIEINGWQNKTFLTRQLMKIGDASYLIYILHFPLLSLYGRLLNHLEKNLIVQHSAAILFVCFITLVSIYLHVRIEAPLVKKLNSFFTPLTPTSNLR
jgi:exopolysaccharide production protein ExoZ